MEKLHVKDEFKVGKNNIGWVGSKFTEVFGHMSFTPLTFIMTNRKLEKSMNDTDILSMLKPQAVSLGDVLYALSYLDKKGWYIFYVNDTKGTLWAVDARWYSGRRGWYVNARSVGRLYGWDVDYQVVSREFTQSLDSVSLRPSDTLSLEQRVEALEQWRQKFSDAIKL